MKIFGFTDSQDTPIELNQATLETDPETLRKLSKFLLTCAEEIEEDNEWEHEHFCDFIGEVTPVEFVVFNADKYKD